MRDYNWGRQSRRQSGARLLRGHSPLQLGRRFEADLAALVVSEEEAEPGGLEGNEDALESADHAGIRGTKAAAKSAASSIDRESHGDRAVI